jgi:hypothetical protein
MALDRSILQRVLLTVGLGLAAACATASPSRPVAEPVPGAPEEFRWLSFRWPDGAVLSYVIETSIETAVAERVTTTRERHRFRMSSMGSVVSGVRRVRIAFDDVDIADALLDEDGHLKDIFVSVVGAEPMIEELRGQSRDLIAADLTTASTCKAHPFVAPRIIRPANTKARYSLWCQ